MNNDNEEDKKKKIHLNSLLIRYILYSCLPPPPYSELSLIQESVTRYSLETAHLCLLSLQEILLPLTA